MKKNKVIIPAMALILFSTAASVSGTVAWFTASRVFQTEVGNFSVVEIDGSLDVTMAASQGTEYDSVTNSVSVKHKSKGNFYKDDSEPATPQQDDLWHNGTKMQICTGTGPTTWADYNLTENDYYFDVNESKLYKATSATAITEASASSVLTHGSVCHTGTNEGHAYVIDGDTQNDENPAFIDRLTDGQTAAKDNWLHKEGVAIADNTTPTPVVQTVDVYNAVSWTMTFKYNFAGDATPVAIYLNLRDSEFEDAEAAPDFTRAQVSPHTEETKLGFRIGFFNKSANTDGHDVVWGNNTSVTPTAFSTESSYKAGDLVTYTDATYKAKTDLAAGAWSAENWDASTELPLTYVSATNAIKRYQKGEYVIHNGSYAKLANLDANEHITFDAATSRAERICLIRKGYVNGEYNSTADTEGYGQIAITCAAWFEGTDPNVVSGASMDCLNAKMSFYSRTVNADA